MTKLTLAYAILALESRGYEQGTNPNAFMKTIEGVSIVCRLTQVKGVIEAAYIANIAIGSDTLQVRQSGHLDGEGDISKAEQTLFEMLNNKVETFLARLKSDHLIKVGYTLAAFSAVMAARARRD